jgi:subfamily B ATP-binding cassette protein MsbA
VALVGLLHVGITRVLQHRIRRSAALSYDNYGNVAAFIQETLLSIRIVKSFSAEKFELRRLKERLAALRQAVLRLGLYTNAESPLRQLADGLALGVVLLASFVALSSGRLTLAGFGLFILIVKQAIPPMTQMGSAFIQVQRLLGTSERLLQILDARPEVVDGPATAAPLREGLALRAVRFEYRPDMPVLRGIDLTIPRGRVVALVGPSGSGKSTLADLVLRLYDPTAGRVTWDGVDIRDFQQQGYRRMFGVVPQEALLLNASVAENIAYGRPLDRDALEVAARIAHVEEFAAALPDGYATLVGDRGVRLSGGQRQRVALARALYGRPDVLILDEATSSLDSESERQVQAAIDNVLHDKTALVIAHRLSTIRRADIIVVISGGQVHGQGPHDELLEASPLYRRLHAAQFRDEPLPVSG